MNEDINFEDAIKRLEEIINELEKNELDLNTLVLKFEEGIKLSNQCNKILEDAERRISILINTEDGLIEEDF